MVLIGVVFVAAPSWSQERFPWLVSDFVTMTIGGWRLGYRVPGRGGRPAAVDLGGAVHPSLVYLWAFGALELGVAVWFRDLLRTDQVRPGPIS